LELGCGGGQWSAFLADDGTPSNTLTGDHFNLHRVDEDGGGTTFVLGDSDWIRLFRSRGLAVENLSSCKRPKVR